MNWWENLRGRVRLKEPLKLHTTFKIGGPAKYFIEPRDAVDLKFLLESVKSRKIPLMVIGAGSNILVADRGVNACVVKLSPQDFGKIDFKPGGFVVGAGCPLNRVIAESKNRGVSSLELLAGIPGTVGGALVMNAGVPGKNIGDLVEEITVMDYNGKVKQLKRSEAKFTYRGSKLSKYIILAASFRSRPKRAEEIAAMISSRLSMRRDKQEWSLPSAGCVFKNPAEEISAGRLIDLCGLKGERAGNAVISEKHANFIVNAGSASARDVARLMRLATRRVKNKFNIDLQPEIKIWR
ncbi:MAG: UDP-N-acetylmuramate dehydrogenase [Candidatus Omnitrophota bacterium]